MAIEQIAAFHRVQSGKANCDISCSDAPIATFDEAQAIAQQATAEALQSIGKRRTQPQNDQEHPARQEFQSPKRPQ
jgi:hypothetical protein